MSKLGDIYTAVYGSICGSPPCPRPWHFQWLSTVDLHRDLRELGTALHGDLLDLGCGTKPYASWFNKVRSHIGADVMETAQADVVITVGERLPFPDGSFDSVLCTQVLEHVSDTHDIAEEIARVLRPGGCLLLSVPFLYHLHGAPHDYQRLTEYGLQKLLERNFTIRELRRQGRIGSTLAVMLLGWIEAATNRTFSLRLAKGFLIPLWVALCAVTNLLGRVLDMLDGTQGFYHNMLAVALKKP